MEQGVQLEPTLKAIADFLDQHGDIVHRVRRDLERGLKNRQTGRPGLTPQQVLRSLILMRVKNWDYRELRERIADGYTLRHFTQFDSHRVPKHDAFNRGVNRLRPATLEAINQAVIRAAVGLGLEDGQEAARRYDGGRDRHPPPHRQHPAVGFGASPDRLVRKLDALLPAGVGPFTNRTRSARRRMQEIQRMTPTERHRRQVRTYRALIAVRRGDRGRAGGRRPEPRACAA